MSRYFTLLIVILLTLFIPISWMTGNVHGAAAAHRGKPGQMKVVGACGRVKASTGLNEYNPDLYNGYAGNGPARSGRKIHNLIRL